MVGNKHGIGSILSFAAKSVNPKLLEKLLVGRSKVVDQLEKRINNIALDGLNHQVLIVGARGTGKTHVLRVLFYRLEPFIKKRKIKVAYFAEEEYGISGYLDFMVRILNAFIRWNDNDADYLKEQLTILQDTPSSHQEDTIKRIIANYIGNEPLLILAENFNDILSSLKHAGQSKLRNWLQESNRISIIATSQALSDDVGKEDKPFYGFFDEIQLMPLSLEESFLLLKSLAQIDGKEEIIRHLNTKGKGQVKAIHSLVKGNHRLLITFYEFLKSDLLSDLSIMFIKTLNDLKPYYETYIRYLPPQQQKILRFIALAKNPQKGTDIARECFIEQKSLSKQISELDRKKLIEIITDPEDKRNKLYDISEPLLRISIEIGEQKEGISALFIDFLALYYNNEELELQKIRLTNELASCSDPKEKQQYSFEIVAREKALELQNQKNYPGNIEDIKIGKVIDFLDQKEYEKAASILSELSHLETGLYYDLLSSTFYFSGKFVESKNALLKAIELQPSDEALWHNLGVNYISLDDEQAAVKAFKKVVELNPEDAGAFYTIGFTLAKNKDYSEAVEYLKRAIKIDSSYQEAYAVLGNVYSDMGELNLSLKQYNKAIKIDPNDEITWFNIGLNYENLNRFNDAVKAYLKAIEINPTDTDTLFNLGGIYDELKMYEEAKKTFEKLLKIEPENFWALQNLGLMYSKTDMEKKAVEIFKKAIELDSKEEQIWLYLAHSYYNMNRLEDANKSFKKTLEINDENERAWLGMGINYSDLGEYKNAILCYKKVLSIDKNNYFALFFLSNAYIQTQKMDKAKSIAHKILLSDFRKSTMKEEALIEIIVFSMLNILQYDLDLDIEKCLKIERTIKNSYPDFDELKIPMLLLKTFRKVELEGNKKAFYKLPKEQREFFENEILNRRNQEFK